MTSANARRLFLRDRLGKDVRYYEAIRKKVTWLLWWQMQSPTRLLTSAQARRGYVTRYEHLWPSIAECVAYLRYVDKEAEDVCWQDTSS